MTHKTTKLIYIANKTEDQVIFNDDSLHGIEFKISVGNESKKRSYRSQSEEKLVLSLREAFRSTLGRHGIQVHC